MQAILSEFLANVKHKFKPQPGFNIRPIPPPVFYTSADSDIDPLSPVSGRLFVQMKFFDQNQFFIHSFKPRLFCLTF